MTQSHKLKLVYDVTSMPTGLDPSNMVRLYESNNVVFWDSSKAGIKPALFNTTTDEEVELALVDTQGATVDLEPFLQKYMDDEFWDKELHKCKQSPLYYFNNYLTLEFPVKNEKQAEYLKSINLGDLPTDDSEKAQEAWEKKKEARVSATKNITVEMLKELRPNVEEMQQVYEAKISKLETKYNSRLADTETGVLRSEAEKRRVLIKDIKKHGIPAEYSKYRNKKNKWDLPMLAATDYTVLLELFDSLQPAVLREV